MNSTNQTRPNGSNVVIGIRGRGIITPPSICRAGVLLNDLDPSNHYSTGRLRDIPDRALWLVEVEGYPLAKAVKRSTERLLSLSCVKIPTAQPSLADELFLLSICHPTHSKPFPQMRARATLDPTIVTPIVYLVVDRFKSVEGTMWLPSRNRS